MEKNGAAPAPAPTGCFKCGRPGHWSRDCPFSNPDSTTNSNPNPKSSINNPNPPRPPFKNTNFPSKFLPEKTIEKPKKVPRVRPKLTPDLLLSDDGLGYILKHFPKAFKFHGRGHEVADLGNLIELYSQWHSHLIPYYSFEQFVHKVEQVGATKRVRTTLRDLRDRVANGGDPSKLHEAPVEHNAEDMNPVAGEVRTDGSILDQEGPPLENHDFANVTEVTENGASNLSESQITEEQRARMEANRQKALEKIASQKNPPAESYVDDYDDVDEVIEEEMPEDFYALATEEPSQSALDETPVVEESPVDVNASQLPENGVSGLSEAQITEEQRARETKLGFL